MRLMLYSVIASLLLLLNGDNKDRYVIMLFSDGFDHAVINSERKEVGHKFSPDSDIYWQPGLAMEIRDTKTGDLILLTNKTVDVITGHKRADYGKTLEVTSVNAASEEYLAVTSDYHYLSYETGGTEKKVRLETEMSISQYPESLSLYFHKENKEGESEEILLTDNMRGFLEALSQASDEAKEVLAGFPRLYKRNEDENRMRSDYMFLIFNHIDEEYYGIEYNYNDLKLFLSIKQ